MALTRSDDRYLLHAERFEIARRLDADMFQEPFQQREFPSCIIITFQVMAIPWVSPGDPDAVGPMTQGRKDEFGADAA